MKKLNFSLILLSMTPGIALAGTVIQQPVPGPGVLALLAAGVAAAFLLKRKK